MKTSIILFSATLCALNIFAQGTAFTFQGRLNDGSSPANGSYDLIFSLWSNSSGPARIGGTITNSATAVGNGLFTVTIDFGASFPGADRWLEIAVRTNAGGAFTTLSPRQRITPAPYAITAGDVVSANVARLNVPNTAVQAAGHPIVTSGFITSAVVDNPGAGYLTAPSVTVNANGPGSGATVTATISGGSVTALNIMNAGSGYTGSPTLTIGAPPANNYQVFVTSNFFPNVNVFSNPSNVFAGNGAGLSGLWQLSGNAGTDPTNGNFLGTTDNQPLEIKINSRRVLRLEHDTNSFFGTVLPNVIAGYESNSVARGAGGATIAGGGGPEWFGATPPLQVGGHFGAIGGGVGNVALGSVATIAGGERGFIGSNGYNSFIGGGAYSRIDTSDSVINGGRGNAIRDASYGGVVGGGNGNIIESNSPSSVIGGGSYSSIAAFAPNSAIPGGNNNRVGAGASAAFAAGTRAVANHSGTFVWADSTGSDFISTAANQFLVRAANGVGIGTASPGAQLEVRTTAANANAIRFGYASGGAGNLIAGPSRVSIATDDLIERFVIRQGSGNVGIGLTGPNYLLQLAVDSAAKPNGGSWANSSDARLKRNIVTMTNAVERLTQLRGVIFEWVNPEDHANQRGTQGGFIAQDVEKAFPKWVTEVDAAEHDRTLTADGKIKSLTLPFEFDALVVEAIKEQQAQIQARDKEIAELKQRLSALEQKFSQAKPNAETIVSVAQGGNSR